MRKAAFILVLAWGATAQGARQAPSVPAKAEEASTAQTIDGIAARIDTDIITESEVRELGEFQTLVDGRAKPREEILRELEDQWIVRGEAQAARYAPPQAGDVDKAYRQLIGQFSSAEEFEKRRAAAGLTEAAVRRQVEDELYLSQFLYYRFRPSAEISDSAVRDYYDDEFSPQARAKGQTVPPFESVRDAIHEILVQRAINDRSTEWMDETRARLRIDVMPVEANR